MDINKFHHQRQQKKVKAKRSRDKRDKDVKVVYISTPMKVKTSASKFRAIVQELTGRESDVVRIMESSGGIDTWTVPDHHHHYDHDHDHDHDDKRIVSVAHDHKVPQLVLDPESMWSSPSSSEELIDPFDGVLVKAQEGFGPLDSSLLFDQFCHHLDVLGAS